MKTPSDITVVGLGYVGLPLALAFADQIPTVGFDNDSLRIEQLLEGVDRNREVASEVITASSLTLTSNENSVTNSDFIIVTVPTPVTEDFRPDLTLLESASAMIGRRLRDRSGDRPAPIVVFESTTYPGCTEDFCGPIIERESGLKSGEGFILAYSPERTNFGDVEHTLGTVVKVVSAQTDEAAGIVGSVYRRIAKAGVHTAPDIKTAEASKVIENVQRDLNIALFNETAMIFDRMGIDSSDVFDAAGTKWNFHQYQPGLVGGHCIPVDPYYLTYAAKQVGYQANVILAGRSVNENMVDRIDLKIQELVRSAGNSPDETDVLILGQTFKSDVADFRNSKAMNLTSAMSESFRSVATFDPFAGADDGNQDPFDCAAKFDVVVLAVGHAQFTKSISKVVDLVVAGGILVDLTGRVDRSRTADSDLLFWKL
ncbi:nucleotide sugar dehydrogenase [Candidatus Lucifugimonas marina]|uniref:nucleotide sugar dehydrogenase n=1 Tax=Candidatus Lucifugimonas marina TaxID=3038979 RepID=UPI00319DE4A6